MSASASYMSLAPTSSASLAVRQRSTSSHRFQPYPERNTTTTNAPYASRPSPSQSAGPNSRTSKVEELGSTQTMTWDLLMTGMGQVLQAQRETAQRMKEECIKAQQHREVAEEQLQTLIGIRRVREERLGRAVNGSNEPAEQQPGSGESSTAPIGLSSAPIPPMLLDPHDPTLWTTYSTLDGRSHPHPPKYSHGTLTARSSTHPDLHGRYAELGSSTITPPIRLMTASPARRGATGSTHRELELLRPDRDAVEDHRSGISEHKNGTPGPSGGATGVGSNSIAPMSEDA